MRKLDNENKTHKGKVMLKLLRQLFHHGPPRRFEASDFMNASLRCTAKGQFRVRHGDPSVMLSAFHSPPPTHRSKGPGWCTHRAHRSKPKKLPESSTLDLGEEIQQWFGILPTASTLGLNLSSRPAGCFPQSAWSLTES